MRTHSIPAAALCAAVVTMLAGCAASGNAGHSSSSAPRVASASPAQAVLLAATRAQQVTSFTATIDVQATGTAALTMAGTLNVRTEPSLYFHGAFSNVSAGGQAMPGGMEEILTSKAIYMKMAQVSQLTGGKPWMKFSFSDLQHASGINLGQLIQQVEGNNPLQQTQMLAASNNVRRVGTEAINGVPTTHYAGTLPLSAGIARLPASQRKALEPMLKGLGSATSNFDVWLDAQDQVRKMVMSMPTPAGQETATFYVTAINNPVAAVIPPASEVGTLPTGALNGSGG